MIGEYDDDDAALPSVGWYNEYQLSVRGVIKWQWLIGTDFQPKLFGAYIGWP